jgi:hypothetical protein
MKVANPKEYIEQIDDGARKVATTGLSGERIVWTNVIARCGGLKTSAGAAEPLARTLGSKV